MSADLSGGKDTDMWTVSQHNPKNSLVHIHSLGLLFQESGLPLSVSGSWSGSLCRAHIALQEQQAVDMMLCRMALHLSGKVVALHLDNSMSERGKGQTWKN